MYECMCCVTRERKPNRKKIRPSISNRVQAHLCLSISGRCIRIQLHFQFNVTACRWLRNSPNLNSNQLQATTHVNLSLFIRFYPSSSSSSSIFHLIVSLIREQHRRTKKIYEFMREQCMNINSNCIKKIWDTQIAAVECRLPHQSQ